MCPNVIRTATLIRVRPVRICRLMLGGRTGRTNGGSPDRLPDVETYFVRSFGVIIILCAGGGIIYV